MREPQRIVLLAKLLRHHEPGDGDFNVMASDALRYRALHKHATLDCRPSFTFARIRETVGICAALVNERFRLFSPGSKQAGFVEPERLTKQLNIIFQGASVLSHASGDTSPFLLAKDPASAVLEKAGVAPRRSAISKR
jgi:hypothetical protein